MKTSLLTITVFGILIVTGISLNFDYYQNTIDPVNVMIERFDKISTSDDHDSIQTYLPEISLYLHQVISKLSETNTNGETVSRNPVWLFPTTSTDFLRIQSDVNAMTASVDKISVVPKDSSAYHTGMMDIHARSEHIKENLIDARSFMYASATNIFFTLIWVIGISGLMKTWIKNEN